MKQPSFLARKTLGQPNYFLLAMAAAFVIALVPVGAWQAVRHNTNRPEEWLPPSTIEVQDLAWFRSQFEGAPYVVVSWDGCTLGDPEKLDRLVRQLAPAADLLAKSDANSEAARRARWYVQAVSGKGVLEQLTSPPHNLAYREAVQRVEGVLVGPPQRDAQGSSLGDDSRATCLWVRLTPAAAQDERTTRAALSLIGEIAETTCGVRQDTIHMAGPLVEDVAMDDESQGTLVRLTPLAGLVAFVLCAARLRSVKLAAIVVGVGAISAGMSLAIVFYFGVFERLIMGTPTPQLGRVDALLMSLPVVAFVVAIAVALRLIHTYRQESSEEGASGAVERAVRRDWPASAVAGAVTGVGLAVLYYFCELAPLERFGIFAGITLLAAVGLTVLVVPVALHRFPPATTREQSSIATPGRRAPRWVIGLFDRALEHRIVAIACGLVAIVALGLGVTRIESTVRVPALLDERARLMKDYAWFERHLGNVVPIEVVLTTPVERTRQPDESPEEDGQQYRMTTAERIGMTRTIADRMANVAGVSGVLSAATFWTDQTAEIGSEGAGESPLWTDYLQQEQLGKQPTGRELWRVSGRIASATDAAAAEYDQVVRQLRGAVHPVLVAYQQRDMIVRNLHERGGQLAGAKVGILFVANEELAEPAESAIERQLGELLRASGVAPDGVSYVNLTTLASRGDGADDAFVDQAATQLADRNAVVLSAAVRDAKVGEVVEQLAAKGVNLVDATTAQSVVENAASRLVDAGGPRPIRAVLTGLPPVVHAADVQLVPDLADTALPALGLMTVGMMFATRRALAGIASMLPLLLPAVAVLGALGWVGIGVDLGVVLLAGIALFVAAEGINHYLAAFREASTLGLSPRDAAVWAFDRTAPASIEIAMILGLSLSVFALSGLASMQLLGLVAIPLMSAALVAHLLVLPPMTVGRMAHWFAAVEEAEAEATPVLDAAPSAQHKAAAAMAVPANDSTPAAASAPAAGAPGAGERRDPAEGPHSALHAKLRNLRQSAPRDSKSS